VFNIRQQKSVEEKKKRKKQLKRKEDKIVLHFSNVTEPFLSKMRKNKTCKSENSQQ
jgi:hypothetical protein